jgi:hypothetical protein
MWEPQPLTTVRASTACTEKTLPLLYAANYASISVYDEQFLRNMSEI